MWNKYVGQRRTGIWERCWQQDVASLQDLHQSRTAPREYDGKGCMILLCFNVKSGKWACWTEWTALWEREISLCILYLGIFKDCSYGGTWSQRNSVSKQAFLIFLAKWTWCNRLMWRSDAWAKVDQGLHKLQCPVDRKCQKAWDLEPDCTSHHNAFLEVLVCTLERPRDPELWNDASMPVIVLSDCPTVITS